MLDRVLEKVAHINIRHARVILAAAVIICIFAIWGITRLEINSSYLEEYGPRVKTYHDYKFVDDIMGGSENFEILLHSKTPDGVKTLEFVQTLEKIQRFADAQDYLVSKTVSVVDIIKDINRALHHNDKAFYKLPETDKSVSQLMLLYEASGGEELEKRVSTDIETARLTVYIKSSDSKTSRRFYDDLIAYIDGIIPETYSYEVTGISFLVLKAMEYIGATQISSLAIAMVIISLLMVVVFRSVKVGFISMLPNIFPILLTLGLMGWMGIWLDYVRTLIACIAIGLAVDDTIHFIVRYQLEFNRKGNYEAALLSTMRNVGRAITITTLVLVIGFSMAMTSKLNDSFYFGLLSSVCLFIALLADYFIGPSLILIFKPFGKEFIPTPVNGQQETI
jgi:predicted RND superfamily exporter protein